VVDHYLDQTQQADKAYVENLRNKVPVKTDLTRTLAALEDNAELRGVWIFEAGRVLGRTEYGDMEKEILNLYRHTLRGKDEHTLVMFGSKPYFLVNTAHTSGDILLLADAAASTETRIEGVLDSLVSSSNLRYFAIVNEDNTPIIFSTLYENFLPLKGSGEHMIGTPGGRILQIEEDVERNSIVAGFSMESLDRIVRQNNIFLVLMIIAFAFLEGVLIFNYWKFERFRFKKKREVKRFKEVGALATGFAHEFRNSLHTLTLMARSLNDENSSILLEETSRMKSIMDSLRLLSIRKIQRKEVKVADIVTESISMLDSIIKEHNVTASHNIKEDIRIIGNRALLVTAISNIIRNSIEAGANHIEIRTRRKGQKTKIEIADDGTGIEQSMVGQIFDPFFSKKGQSGIGLYLTKRIIELHHGQVEFARNEKTVFIITLPR
jgi:signal transduction histidine kinase